MKPGIILIVALSLFAGMTSTAQINRSVKKNVTKKADSKTDEAIDKAIDKLEEGIGGLFGIEKKKTSDSQNSTASNNKAKSNISVKGKDPEALFNEYGMYPPDGAIDVPVPVTFRWTSMNSDDFTAKCYEVYVYTEGYADDMLIGAPKENKKTYSKLEPNTTYTWKYVGQNSSGQYMPGGGGTFTTGNGISGADAVIAPQTNVQWSRFDFVPGDEVIFEDGPSASEENGEFPSRWDLVSGNCEIIQVNGENVIAFPKGGSIVPYLKNSKEDYLPDVFTIEFDAWLWWDNQRDIYVYWYDKKNQNNSLRQALEVNSFSLEIGNTYQELEARTKHNGKWRHISIAYTKGKLKAYLDDTRLINLPHYEGNPSGLTIACSGYSGDEPEELQYIKNIRIAKGGVKYYDRVLSDGKIVCNGIKFDVNKATLKPESMGPINEIFNLMQKQPDLKFSVEGHTDSDGDDANNQTLSEQRAKAVMDQLIKMGISADRLTSKGFGESRPIFDNSTAEGKANNRRVEFVKM